MNTIGRNEGTKIANYNSNTIRSSKSTMSMGSINSITEKNPKEIYTMSKLYNKYLTSIKNKISKNNLEETVYGQNFAISYDNAIIIYEQIEKDWFWILNGDKMSQFKMNTKKELNKTVFNNNYLLLRKIAKTYGFDDWSVKIKNREQLF